jgi:hypothetical protein
MLWFFTEVIAEQMFDITQSKLYQKLLDNPRHPLPSFHIYPRFDLSHIRFISLMLRQEKSTRDLKPEHSLTTCFSFSVAVPCWIFQSFGAATISISLSSLVAWGFNFPLPSLLLCYLFQ